MDGTFVYRSTEVGGSTPSGRGRQMLGQEPDVRLIVNTRPMGAHTTNKELATKWSHKQKLSLDPVFADDVEYWISGIGSSSLVDTDGDIFHKSAINGMARDAIDLNVLLNHVPTVPWNIAGSILQAEADFMTLDGSEYSILKLVSDIEAKHPDAWRTYEMIAGIDCRARKLGYSVGCLYLEAKPRTTKSGLYRGVDVYEVLPVEFSIVSMPANRLAWIDTLAHDLQEKGVLPRRPNFIPRKEWAVSQPVIEVITDWMDFGPIDGPRIEKIARYFEEEHGIVFARRPRSAA